jgi:hypothetical protein
MPEIGVTLLSCRRVVADQAVRGPVARDVMIGVARIGAAVDVVLGAAGMMDFVSNGMLGLVAIGTVVSVTIGMVGLVTIGMIVAGMIVAESGVTRMIGASV